MKELIKRMIKNGFITNSIFIIFITGSGSLSADENQNTIIEIENKFIAEKNLKPEYRIDKVPDDILKSIKYKFNEEKLANYGESYNRTSLINPKIPLIQHQFTIYSSKTSASLIRKGGFFLSSHIIIFDRENKSGCIYEISKEVEFYDLFQELIRKKINFISNGTIIKDCKLYKIDQ